MKSLHAVTLGLMAAAVAQRAPPVPPSVGAVNSGKYRNMLLEAGYTQAVIDAKIAAAYAQLYHGNASQQIYWETADNTAYVSDVKNHDVRTEGMGYGMMIMVQLDHQPEFDRIWAWVRAHMYHGSYSDPLYGWSAWHCSTSGQQLASGPAPDGETWFITALYFAAARWGDSTGRFNYTTEANTILWAVTIKDGSQNMFEPNSHVVRFGPGSTFTDPSYFLPAFYVAWSLKTNTTPALWNTTAASTRVSLAASPDANTGLAPNHCNFQGGPGGSDHNFEDDAWRVARNWALDYTWWAADPQQIALSNRILTWFAGPGGGIGKYGDRFTTKGVVTSSAHSPGLVSTNAVACLSANISLAWDFIDEFMSLPIPTGDNINSDRYYSGSLYLEALLMLSGNYRAWL